MAVSKLRRLAVVVTVVAAVMGLTAGCGQQQPEKPQGAATADSGSSVAAENGREAFVRSDGNSPSGQSVDSPTASPGRTDAVSNEADASADHPAASPPASSGQGLTSPTSPSASPSGEASAAPSGQTAASASATPADQSAAPPARTDDADRPKEDAVSISVIGNAEWGTVLEPGSVALKKGDTVGDVLIRTLKSHKLAYETRGAGALFYVTGIDGLFEFDDGPTSGWKFRVNDEVIDRSAGVYKLEPGDRVEWFYATEDEEAGSEGQKP